MTDPRTPKRLFDAEGKMNPVAIGVKLTLQVTVGYPGSRVSDLLMGDHIVPVSNEGLRASLTPIQPNTQDVGDVERVKEEANILREQLERVKEVLPRLMSWAEEAEAKLLVGDEGCFWPVEEARSLLSDMSKMDQGDE